MSQPDGGQWSQYSPDGKWWWDGQQWVPVTGTRAVGRTMERAFEPERLVKRMIIGRLIGCGLALLILGVFAAFLVLGVLGTSLRH